MKACTSLGDFDSQRGYGGCRKTVGLGIIMAEKAHEAAKDTVSNDNSFKHPQPGNIKLSKPRKTRLRNPPMFSFFIGRSMLITFLTTISLWCILDVMLRGWQRANHDVLPEDLTTEMNCKHDAAISSIHAFFVKIKWDEFNFDSYHCAIMGPSVFQLQCTCNVRFPPPPRILPLNMGRTILGAV